MFYLKDKSNYLKTIKLNGPPDIHAAAFFCFYLSTAYQLLIWAEGKKWEGLDEVWHCWCDYIGDPMEASKYLDAVDNITPYS